MFVLRRRAGLTDAEFRRHWRDAHGQLVAHHAATLGIGRYQQVHTRRDLPSFGDRIDGIAEICFDKVSPSGSDADRAVAASALLEDERRFIDLTLSPLWIAREETLQDGVRTGTRINIAMRFDGESLHGIPERLIDAHRGDGSMTLLRTPSNSHTELAAARQSPPPYDAFVEVWSGRPGRADPRQLQAEVAALATSMSEGTTDLAIWCSTVHPIVGGEPRIT